MLTFTNYQLLAYTVATNLPAALLMYAAGEGRPAIHTTVHLGKRPNVIALDLSRHLKRFCLRSLN